MFARGSLVWLASPLALALVTLLVSLWFSSTIGLAATLFLIVVTALLACFFRDPNRSIGDGIVSPADGRIAVIDTKRRKLSVVLGLRNVHVTRAPQNGEVTRLRRLSGGHRPAYEDVSEKNERLEIAFLAESGNVRLVLIAGFIARRIKPYVKVGDNVTKGDRIGIIMFGSRVDLHLPEGFRIMAHLGQRVRAGQSQVAEVIDDSH